MSLIDKVKIITLEGEFIDLATWQQQYGLPVNSEKFGKFFSVSESRFRRDIEEYGHLYVAEPHIIVADRARELYGRPLTFSSYNRNEAKRKSLLAQEKEENDKLPEGEKQLSLRAKTISPHEVFLAGDIDLATRADVKAFVPVLQQAAKDKNVVIRIGYKDYLERSEQVERVEGKKDTWTFVHMDVCPEYYAPGKAWHSKPHPKVWEVPAIW